MNTESEIAKIDDYTDNGVATFVGSIGGVNGYGVFKVFNAQVYVEQSVTFINGDSPSIFVRLRDNSKKWSDWKKVK